MLLATMAPAALTFAVPLAAPATAANDAHSSFVAPDALPGLPVLDAGARTLALAPLGSAEIAARLATLGDLTQAAQETLPPAAGEAAEVAAPAAAAPGAPAPVAVAATDAAASPPEPAKAAVDVEAKQDPWHRFNRPMYSIQQFLDRILLRPLAMAYRAVVPQFLRDAIRNILQNVSEPVVFANDILQLRFDRAGRTLARFALNSSYGLGGMLDLAKLPGVNIPHHVNGFGDTLAYYGVKPGPYIFVPMVGPSNLRDMLGSAANGALLPMSIGYPLDNAPYQAATTVLGGLDLRARADQDLKTLLSSAVDPYATMRSVYLQDRAGAVRALKSRALNPTSSGTIPVLYQAGNSKPAADQGDPFDAALTDPATDVSSFKLEPGKLEPGKTQPAAPHELEDPLADPAN
jgi:phospholipid-binding lipoprotein MlaA